MNDATKLVEDQNLALASYLEALLSEGGMLESAPTLKPVADERTARLLDYFVFTVAGLKLALPRRRVLGVVDYATCTAAPSAHALQLGVVAQPEGDAAVIDTARLVMPGRPALPAYQYVVLITPQPYGLACHGIEGALTIARDAVRWKSDHTQRRWLAGTLIEHKCALLDLDALSEAL